MIETHGLRRRLLLNASLLVVSVLVSVSLVELALSVGGFPTERGLRITHPPDFHETRRHLEYEYDFITNSLGLRNVEISEDKPSGVYRILLAGDSFVEGIGVNGDSTISSFLERELNDGHLVQTINGGLQATGAFEQGRLVRHVGYKLDLDGLLFFVFDNDVSDARASQRVEDMARDDLDKRSGIKSMAHFLWPRTYTASSLAWTRMRQLLDRTDTVSRIVLGAEARGISEARIEEWKANVLPEYGEAIEDGTIAASIFSLSLVSPHYWSGCIDLDQPAMEEKFAKMIELLSANVSDAKDHGIEVGVVYIPSKFQYDPAAHAPGEPWVLAGADIRSRWLSGKAPIRARLETWASRIGVRYLDMTPYYRDATRKGERLTWRLDEHLNAEGNRFTAAVIANWLRESDGFGFLRQ